MVLPFDNTLRMEGPGREPGRDTSGQPCFADIKIKFIKKLRRKKKLRISGRITGNLYLKIFQELMLPVVTLKRLSFGATSPYTKYKVGNVHQTADKIRNNDHMHVTTVNSKMNTGPTSVISSGSKSTSNSRAVDQQKRTSKMGPLSMNSKHNSSRAKAVKVESVQSTSRSSNSSPCNNDTIPSVPGFLPKDSKDCSDRKLGAKNIQSDSGNTVLYTMNSKSNVTSNLDNKTDSHKSRSKTSSGSRSSDHRVHASSVKSSSDTSSVSESKKSSGHGCDRVTPDIPHDHNASSVASQKVIRSSLKENSRGPSKDSVIKPEGQKHTSEKHNSSSRSKKEITGPSKLPSMGHDKTTATSHHKHKPGRDRTHEPEPPMTGSGNSVHEQTGSRQNIKSNKTTSTRIMQETNGAQYSRQRQNKLSDPRKPADVSDTPQLTPLAPGDTMKWMTADGRSRNELPKSSSINPVKQISYTSTNALINESRSSSYGSASQTSLSVSTHLRASAKLCTSNVVSARQYTDRDSESPTPIRQVNKGSSSSRNKSQSSDSGAVKRLTNGSQQHHAKSPTKGSTYNTIYKFLKSMPHKHLQAKFAATYKAQGTGAPLKLRIKTKSSQPVSCEIVTTRTDNTHTSSPQGQNPTYTTASVKPRPSRSQNKPRSSRSQNKPQSIQDNVDDSQPTLSTMSLERVPRQQKTVQSPPQQPDSLPKLTSRVSIQPSPVDYLIRQQKAKASLMTGKDPTITVQKDNSQGVQPSLIIKPKTPSIPHMKSDTSGVVCNDDAKEVASVALNDQENMPKFLASASLRVIKSDAPVSVKDEHVSQTVKPFDKCAKTPGTTHNIHIMAGSASSSDVVKKDITSLGEKVLANECSSPLDETNTTKLVEKRTTEQVEKHTTKQEKLTTKLVEKHTTEQEEKLTTKQEKLTAKPVKKLTTKPMENHTTGLVKHTTKPAELHTTKLVEVHTTKLVEDLTAKPVEKLPTNQVEKHATQQVEKLVTKPVVKYNTKQLEDHLTEREQEKATKPVKEDATNLVEEHATKLVEEHTTKPVEEHTTKLVEKNITKPIQEHTSKPVKEQATEPINEQATELVKEQATKPVKELATKLVEEQATKPVKEQATKLVKEQATKPLEECTTKPVEKRATKPVKEQAIKPVKERIIKPVKEQATILVKEQTTKPVKEQTTKPVKEQATKPVKEQTTKPVKEQTTKPVKEQTTKPVKERIIKPVKEQTTKPVKEQATELVKEQTTKPVKEQATKPVKEQATKPVKEQATEPVKEQATELVKEQATKPVKEQATKPVKEQTTKPVKEQATKPVKEQVTEPLEERTTKPVKELATKLVKEQATELVKEQATKPVKEQVTKLVKEQVTEPVKEQVTEPVKEQVTEPLEERTTKPVEEQATKPVKEHTSKLVKELATKPIEEHTTKPVQEYTSKPVKELATKLVEEQATKPVEEKTTKPVKEQAIIQKEEFTTAQVEELTTKRVEMHNESVSDPQKQQIQISKERLTVLEPQTVAPSIKADLDCAKLLPTSSIQNLDKNEQVTGLPTTLPAVSSSICTESNSPQTLISSSYTELAIKSAEKISSGEDKQGNIVQLPSEKFKMDDVPTAINSQEPDSEASCLSTNDPTHPRVTNSTHATGSLDSSPITPQLESVSSSDSQAAICSDSGPSTHEKRALSPRANINSTSIYCSGSTESTLVRNFGCVDDEHSLLCDSKGQHVKVSKSGGMMELSMNSDLQPSIITNKNDTDIVSVENSGREAISSEQSIGVTFVDYDDSACEKNTSSCIQKPEDFPLTEDASDIDISRVQSVDKYIDSHEHNQDHLSKCLKMESSTTNKVVSLDSTLSTQGTSTLPTNTIASTPITTTPATSSKMDILSTQTKLIDSATDVADQVENPSHKDKSSIYQTVNVKHPCESREFDTGALELHVCMDQHVEENQTFPSQSMKSVIVSPVSDIAAIPAHRNIAVSPSQASKLSLIQPTTPTNVTLSVAELTNDPVPTECAQESEINNTISEKPKDPLQGLVETDSKDEHAEEGISSVTPSDQKDSLTTPSECIGSSVEEDIIDNSEIKCDRPVTEESHGSTISVPGRITDHGSDNTTPDMAETVNEQVHSDSTPDCTEMKPCSEDYKDKRIFAVKREMSKAEEAQGSGFSSTERKEHNGSHSESVSDNDKSINPTTILIPDIQAHGMMNNSPHDFDNLNSGCISNDDVQLQVSPHTDHNVGEEKDAIDSEESVPYTDSNRSENIVTLNNPDLPQFDNITESEALSTADNAEVTEPGAVENSDQSCSSDIQKNLVTTESDQTHLPVSVSGSGQLLGKNVPDNSALDPASQNIICQEDSSQLSTVSGAIMNASIETVQSPTQRTEDNLHDDDCVCVTPASNPRPAEIVQQTGLPETNEAPLYSNREKVGSGYKLEANTSRRSALEVAEEIVKGSVSNPSSGNTSPYCDNNLRNDSLHQTATGNASKQNQVSVSDNIAKALKVARQRMREPQICSVKPDNTHVCNKQIDNNMLEVKEVLENLVTAVDNCDTVDHVMDGDLNDSKPNNEIQGDELESDKVLLSSEDICDRVESETISSIVQDLIKQILDSIPSSFEQDLGEYSLSDDNLKTSKDADCNSGTTGHSVTNNCGSSLGFEDNIGHSVISSDNQVVSNNDNSTDINDSEPQGRDHIADCSPYLLVNKSESDYEEHEVPLNNNQNDIENDLECEEKNADFCDEGDNCMESEIEPVSSVYGTHASSEDNWESHSEDGGLHIDIDAANTNTDIVSDELQHNQYHSVDLSQQSDERTRAVSPFPVSAPIVNRSERMKRKKKTKAFTAVKFKKSDLRITLSDKYKSTKSKSLDEYDFESDNDDALMDSSATSPGESCARKRALSCEHLTTDATSSKRKKYPRRQSVFYATDISTNTQNEVTEKKKKSTKRKKSETKSNSESPSEDRTDPEADLANDRLDMEFSKHNWIFKKYRSVLQPGHEADRLDLESNSADNLNIKLVCSPKQSTKDRKNTSKKKALRRKKSHLTIPSDLDLSPKTIESPHIPDTHGLISPSSWRPIDTEQQMPMCLTVKGSPQRDVSCAQGPSDVIENYLENAYYMGDNVGPAHVAGASDVDAASGDFKIVEVVSLAGFISNSDDKSDDAENNTEDSKPVDIKDVEALDEKNVSMINDVVFHDSVDIKPVLPSNEITPKESGDIDAKNVERSPIKAGKSELDNVSPDFSTNADIPLSLVKDKYDEPLNLVKKPVSTSTMTFDDTNEEEEKPLDLSLHSVSNQALDLSMKPKKTSSLPQQAYKCFNIKDRAIAGETNPQASFSPTNLTLPFREFPSNVANNAETSSATLTPTAPTPATLTPTAPTPVTSTPATSTPSMTDKFTTDVPSNAAMTTASSSAHIMPTTSSLTISNSSPPLSYSNNNSPPLLYSNIGVRTPQNLCTSSRPVITPEHSPSVKIDDAGHVQPAPRGVGSPISPVTHVTQVQLSKEPTILPNTPPSRTTPLTPTSPHIRRLSQQSASPSKSPSINAVQVSSNKVSHEPRSQEHSPLPTIPRAIPPLIHGGPRSLPISASHQGTAHLSTSGGVVPSSMNSHITTSNYRAVNAPLPSQNATQVPILHPSLSEPISREHAMVTPPERIVPYNPTSLVKTPPHPCAVITQVSSMPQTSNTVVMQNTGALQSKIINTQAKAMTSSHMQGTQRNFPASAPTGQFVASTPLTSRQAVQYQSIPEGHTLVNTAASLGGPVLTRIYPYATPVITSTQPQMKPYPYAIPVTTGIQPPTKQIIGQPPNAQYPVSSQAMPRYPSVPQNSTATTTARTHAAPPNQAYAFSMMQQAQAEQNLLPHRPQPRLMVPQSSMAHAGQIQQMPQFNPRFPNQNTQSLNPPRRHHQPAPQMSLDQRNAAMQPRLQMVPNHGAQGLQGMNQSVVRERTPMSNAQANQAIPAIPTNPIPKGGQIVRPRPIHGSHPQARHMNPRMMMSHIPGQNHLQHSVERFAKPPPPYPSAAANRPMIPVQGAGGRPSTGSVSRPGIITHGSSPSTSKGASGKIQMPLAHINCEACGQKANFLCSGCKRIAYCSPKCQLRAWKSHKNRCMR